MSRKHYILIAATLRDKIDGYRAASNPNMTGTDSAVFALEETAAALAREFASDNPRFDYNRFMIAAIGRTI